MNRAGFRGRACAALVLTVAATGAGACGSEAHDLFLVTREGSIPRAGLTLRVTDDGRASCNGKPLVDVTSAQLITAREIERELTPLAERRVSLPAGRGSIMRYRVRVETGAVSFADTSPRQPAALFRLAKLTRDVARQRCGLPR